MSEARATINVSHQRVTEILQGKAAATISALMLEVAQLSAVNEALSSRIQELERSVTRPQPASSAEPAIVGTSQSNGTSP